MSLPYDGESTDANTPAIRGNNAAPSGNPIGIFGSSLVGEAVHGETNATGTAALAGWALNTSNTVAAVWGWNKGSGAGAFGHGEAGEGVHGESNSVAAAAVAGYQLNPAGTGAGVWGKTSGKGAGIWGQADHFEAIHGETNGTGAAAIAGFALNAGNTVAAIWGWSKGTGSGVFGHGELGEGVHGESNSAVYAGVAGIQVNPTGTGAGVYGESQGKGPAGYFKGDLQVTGSVTVSGDIILPGADCAEEFDMAGNIPPVPGAVMIIDHHGALAVAAEPYDTRVAGVISGAGTYRPALTLDRRTDAPNVRGALALIGKAWCQVDASEAPIRVGDLLTTSATPGHAMRANRDRLTPGTIIGKALASLEEGTGLIPMLITLQ